jgi:predicted N-acetyltransferase YhbS
MTQNDSTILIRQATMRDAPRCGQIMYDAFANINSKHGFPPDVPSPEAGVGLLTHLFSHPGYHCIVAEVNGQVIGSNCVDERGSIAGLGPITVDVASQDISAGRRLMQASIDHALARNMDGIRLLQAAFHNRSLSLYTKLGFDPREPMSIMQGTLLSKPMDGCLVRPASAQDAIDAERICRTVHGHTRTAEFLDGIATASARVVERNGEITGYCSGIGFFVHAVGLENIDIQALLANAEGFQGPGVLVPTRNAALFRWCLQNGLRVVYPMTLMAMGFYQEPKGAYLPSVLY